jgi:hypothetical protein
MDIQTVADLRAALRNGILGVIVSSSSALADVPSPSPQTRAPLVFMVDIDRSTAAGQFQAHDRQHETARVCAPVADAEDLSQQTNALACLEDSLTPAQKQVGTAKVAGEPHAAGQVSVAAPSRHLCAPSAHRIDRVSPPHIVKCTVESISTSTRLLQGPTFASAGHMTTDEHSSP